MDSTADFLMVSKIMAIKNIKLSQNLQSFKFAIKNHNPTFDLTFNFSLFLIPTVW